MKRVLIFVGLKIVEIAAAVVVHCGLVALGVLIDMKVMPSICEGYCSTSDVWFFKWIGTPLVIVVTPLAAFGLCCCVYWAACGWIKANWSKAGEFARSGVDVPEVYMGGEG